MDTIFNDVPPFLADASMHWWLKPIWLMIRFNENLLSLYGVSLLPQSIGHALVYFGIFIFLIALEFQAAVIISLGIVGVSKRAVRAWNVRDVQS